MEPIRDLRPKDTLTNPFGDFVIESITRDSSREIFGYVEVTARIHSGYFFDPINMFASERESSLRHKEFNIKMDELKKQIREK